MTDWDEIERKRYTQCGKGAGEFRSPWRQIENNADNPYQKRQGNKSPSPHFKKYLDTKPKTLSEPDGVEAYENEGGFISPDSEKREKGEYDINRKIKWGDNISLEEIIWRHKMRQGHGQKRRKTPSSAL
jgi:hypothetical protein